MAVKETKLTLKELLSDVEPKYITPYLIKNGVISLEEEVYICFKTADGRTDTGEKLVEILTQKGQEALSVFFKYLHEFYPWVKLKVREWLDTELKHKLELGQLRAIQMCEVNRASEVDRIQKALIAASLSNLKPQWILVHGMMGAGKTNTVSQAIRQFYVNELYFPDGIFFLPIGNNSEENALLLKLQDLCHYFEENYHPSTIQAGISFLKKQTQKYKKFLLILDDVWNINVIKTFEIGWTILITSRDRIKLNYNREQVTNIEHPKGFTLEESKNHISQWIYVNPDDLLHYAKILHDKYQGLPFVMSMIGTGMAEHGNDEIYWKNMCDTMINNKIERFRRLSGPIDLTKEIKMMVDNLQPEIKECFKDFLLFWDDFYIPCKVFEVLWSANHMEVEAVMDDLATKSLIQIMKDENPCHHRYGIHDLYLKFLKEEYSDYKKDCHEKLVRKYLELCINKEGTLDLGLLPQDNYIHFFLAYHLERAEMYNYFPIIFFDLKFFTDKIKKTGPSDFHHDLVTNSARFIGHEDTLNDFIQFISQNGHNLARNDVDVIQLALNEPQTSSVYRKAIDLLIKTSTLNSSPKHIYFEYYNRLSNYNMLLSVRPHANSVSWVVFSPCNKLIASCGDDNLVKICDSNSGKQIHQFIGHEDAVTCCAFSNDGHHIASSSQDKTVRIWTLSSINDMIEYCSSPSTPRPRSGNFIFSETADPAKNCALIFSEHSDSVTTCAFSSDDRMIASGSEDGTVLVWYPSSGDVKHQLRYHENSCQINHCCFSPDNQYVASCSVDSNIFIWDMYTGQISKRFFHDDKSVESCRFSSDGNILISASGRYVWKWDIESEKPIYQYNNLKTVYYVKCCAFSLDEKKIIGGTSERAVVVWAESNGAIDSSYKCHSGEVRCVNIANDGSKLVSASEDGTVMIFDMNVDKPGSLVSLMPEFSVRFINEVPLIATIDECNKIKVIDGFTNKKKYLNEQPQQDDITCCYLSPDGSKLLFGTKSGVVNVLCLKTKKTTPFDAHGCEISYCLFLDEGKKFISASNDGHILLWEYDELGRGGSWKPLLAHKGKVLQCVPYQMYGHSCLLSCSEDGLLIAWNLENYEDVHKMEHRDTVTSCDVSLNHKFFASTSVDKTARIWDSENGLQLYNISFSKCVRFCKFSPNGIYLAAGDDEGIVKVFNIKCNKKEIKELRGHEGWVKDIVWSQHSDKLVSVADEICWWDVTNPKSDGELLQKFLVKGKRIRHIFASNDFKVFVTIDANGILYILKQIDI